MSWVARIGNFWLKPMARLLGVFVVITMLRVWLAVGQLLLGGTSALFAAVVVGIAIVASALLWKIGDKLLRYQP